MSITVTTKPATTKPGEYPSQRRPEVIIAHYLSVVPMEERGINLGCGGAVFKRWLNIDSEYPWHVDMLWDLTKGLPFLPEACISAVYSEHFMEHIPRKVALTLMRDCFRGLRSGGHIRIAMPDLDDMMKNYAAGAHLPHDDKEFEEEFGGMFHTRCEWFNVAMRAWGHTYVYNFEDAGLLLQAAGFVDVVRKELNDSDVPMLANRETRPAVQSSLILEARKP
jgi:predicted SAM-dependent methyltransferase